MAANIFSAKNQLRALAALMDKITCVTTEKTGTGECETTSKVTWIKIGWYLEFLKGTKVTYLEDQNEDKNFTLLLPVMSSSYFVCML